MAETETLAHMQKYITNTCMKNAIHYDLKMPEIRAIFTVARREPFAAMSLLFKFGRAKGYRMAIAEMKKGTI